MATAVVFVAYLSATITDVAVALVKIAVAVMTAAVEVKEALTSLANRPLCPTEDFVLSARAPVG